jgi:hypothetical protein
VDSPDRAHGGQPRRPRAGGQRDGAEPDAEQDQPDQAELGGGLQVQGVRVVGALPERPLAAPAHRPAARADAAHGLGGERAPGDAPVLVAVAAQGDQAAGLRGEAARVALLGAEQDGDAEADPDHRQRDDPCVPRQP